MKAVILLSGGIDSATTLYYARAKGYKPFCLIFDYGQRHIREIDSARKIASRANAKHTLLKINLLCKGSSLLNKSLRLPGGRTSRNIIPNTYVPGRNIIFLSYAVSYAEAINADAVFIGANQIDYSGYPDCRSSFLKAFEGAINKGTGRGIKGNRIKIIAPLINKTKPQIIRDAVMLGVRLRDTWSCYKGTKAPCGECDSCLIRSRGFKGAGLKDPLLYGE